MLCGLKWFRALFNGEKWLKGLWWLRLWFRWWCLGKCLKWFNLLFLGKCLVKGWKCFNPLFWGFCCRNGLKWVIWLFVGECLLNASCCWLTFSSSGFMGTLIQTVLYCSCSWNDVMFQFVAKLLEILIVWIIVMLSEFAITCNDNLISYLTQMVFDSLCNIIKRIITSPIPLTVKVFVYINK